MALETYRPMLPKSQKIEAARRYAAADRSDPFAFGRAMAHIKNGIADDRKDRDQPVTACHYDAEETQERRSLPTGITFSDGTSDYVVPAYKNVKRP